MAKNHAKTDVVPFPAVRCDEPLEGETLEALLELTEAFEDHEELNKVFRVLGGKYGR